jgi:aspartokinase-like uncharacterized kinase
VSGRWQSGVLREPASRAEVAPPLIIKLGGSLLARPAWPDDIITLVGQVDRPTLLVVGGGRIVDALRRIDATAPRPPAVMHRLAIDSLGLTARLVADALGLPLTSEPREDARLAVLDTPAWLEIADTDGTRFERLPVGWHVTSDSIAALVTTVHDARLLLAKSAPPPGRETALVRLADRGWVDGYFPTAAAMLADISWAAPGAEPN